jgi:hypothetical protein
VGTLGQHLRHLREPSGTGHAPAPFLIWVLRHVPLFCLFSE